MRRMFIGVKASEKLARLANIFSREKTIWPVRWLTGDNLHLTLIPPFYDEPDKIIKKLENIDLKTAPFSIKFNRISFGPTMEQCRLIWATGPVSEELCELKKKIENALEIKPAKRTLLPHLTLARFSRQDHDKLKDLNLDESIEWKDEIVSYEIIESVLKPQGAEYIVWKSFELWNR